ncbi:MAG TPA: ABC transporter permease [Cyclobacteriaceae bacterium]
MLYNSLLIASRNLLKNKIYSFINLAGLATGISAFILLWLYINYEKSYDQFHVNKDRIFRLQQERVNQGNVTQQTVAGCAGAGPDMKNAFAEIEYYVKINKASPVMLYNGVGYKEEHGCFASEDFFKVFSFRLIQGDASQVLKRPNTVVLSQAAAKRIFKEEDPIGKIIAYKGRYECEVTGVFEDMPENSHMKLDVIVSFATYDLNSTKFVLEEPWRWDSYITYVQLHNDSDASAVEAKLPKLIESKTGAWLKETNQRMSLHLQPLTSIHLHSNFSDEFEINGSYKLVLYLTVIALFILVIAWLNYISLATAKSFERAKEVGIRKVLGGHRIQLIVQFLTESILLNVLAAVISLLIVYFSLPYFTSLTGSAIQLEFLNLTFWRWVIIIIVAGSFVSGLYPAFILSSFNPAHVLKGKFSGSASGKFMRNVLVLVPYVTAILLISCLYIIFKQISFLKNQELGFDVEQKLVIRDSEVYDSLYEKHLSSFKKEVVRIPGIEKMTYVAILPGQSIDRYANSVKRLKAPDTEVNQYKYISVDEHFIEVQGLKLIAGRNFTDQSKKKEVVLINELASARLGFSKPEDAVDEEIVFRDDTVRVIGVVNNFYHESPKNPLLPVIYPYNPDAGFFFLIPVKASVAQEKVEAIRSLFAEIYSGQPFDYFFLDDFYNHQYQADVRFGKVVGLFSTLLILVTALGLLGLSTYTASMRTKEIGIRKVLGASTLKVIMMLCKGYFILMLLAAVVAIPCAWYVMDIWLSAFAVRITLTPWLFIIPAIVIISVTLATISFQTLRAALKNPVDTLKYE